jgi:glutathione S-transferase
MALVLYGSAQSRAMRVLWMLAELGLEFEHVAVGFADPFLKSPGFLKLNPAGQIPVLADGDIVLSESLGINLYLAKRQRSALYPSDPASEARVINWTLWATYELESLLAKERRRPPQPDQRDRWLEAPLSVLEAVLAGSGYLVGGSFSVADLNVASTLSPSRREGLDLGPFPNVRGWLERCEERPARLKARQT